MSLLQLLSPLAFPQFGHQRKRAFGVFSAFDSEFDDFYHHPVDSFTSLMGAPLNLQTLLLRSNRQQSSGRTQESKRLCKQFQNISLQSSNNVNTAEEDEHLASDANKSESEHSELDLTQDGPDDDQHEDSDSSDHYDVETDVDSSDHEYPLQKTKFTDLIDLTDDDDAQNKFLSVFISPTDLISNFFNSTEIASQDNDTNIKFDVTENETEYLVKAQLPTFFTDAHKNQLRLNIQENKYLVLSADVNVQKKSKNFFSSVQYHLNNSLLLPNLNNKDSPVSINEEQISASFKKLNQNSNERFIVSILIPKVHQTASLSADSSSSSDPSQLPHASESPSSADIPSDSLQDFPMEDQYVDANQQ